MSEQKPLKYVSMIPFYGQQLYIDVDELEKFLLTPSNSGEDEHIVSEYDSEDKLIAKTVTKNKVSNPKSYDSVKYELVRYLFDTLTLDVETENDTTLGLDKLVEKMSLPTILAYNTLAGYGILKKF